MKKNCFLLTLFTLIFFLSCTSKQDYIDFKRLSNLDSLISTNPQLVVDSLKKVHISSLSKYNYGYYLLLDVVSKDKTYYEFHSDSLIKLSVKRLLTKKKQYPYNYARGLMYEGLVRYRMGANDSTVYKPLKQALDIIENVRIEDYNNQYLCNYYLGSLMFDNVNDTKRCLKYYKRALHFSEIAKRFDYQFNIYIELFWVFVKNDDFNKAKQALDILSKINNGDTNSKLTIDYLSTVYYHYTNNTDKSVEKCNEVLNGVHDEKNEYKIMSVMYLRMSDYYMKRNLHDSAMFYIEKSIVNIADTSSSVNYLYYSRYGEIAEKSNLWQKSALAYKKAYELKNKAVSKELDKNILELEKKYDLTQAENTALHFRTRAVLLGFLSILLIVLLISFTIIIRQKSRQTNLRIRLAEQKNLLLEQEKLKIERSLIEKEFVLPIYQQISQRNANLKGLLYDLKTNVYISKNSQLAESISSTYADFVSVSEIKPDKFLSDEKFKSITGIDEAKSAQLNESDKMLIVFIVLEIDTRQIAVLFNTSESSIRGRKTKLRVKLESLNIEIRNLEL